MQKEQKQLESSLSKSFIGRETTLPTSTTDSSKRASTTQWQRQNSEQILDGQCDEAARIQHEIQMTDDPHYRDWHNKLQKQMDIDKHGIDED